MEMLKKRGGYGRTAGSAVQSSRKMYNGSVENRLSSQVKLFLIMQCALDFS